MVSSCGRVLRGANWERRGKTVSGEKNLQDGLRVWCIREVGWGVTFRVTAGQQLFQRYKYEDSGEFPVPSTGQANVWN